MDEKKSVVVVVYDKLGLELLRIEAPLNGYCLPKMFNSPDVSEARLSNPIGGVFVGLKE